MSSGVRKDQPFRIAYQAAKSDQILIQWTGFIENSFWFPPGHDLELLKNLQQVLRRFLSEVGRVVPCAPLCAWNQSSNRIEEWRRSRWTVDRLRLPNRRPNDRVPGKFLQLLKSMFQDLPGRSEIRSQCHKGVLIPVFARRHGERLKNYFNPSTSSML